MVSRYAPVVREGTESDAKKFCEQYGGEVYIGRHKAWFTVANGKRKAVFWNPDRNGQQVRIATYQLAQEINISLEQHPDLTPSKLVDLFLKEIIGVNPEADKKKFKKSGYYGENWSQFAKRSKGNEENFNHWSYQHWEPHEPQYLVDRDIKSAFPSSLITAPTLFLYEHKNSTSTFIDDGGAMGRLKEWYPYLPKWFRKRLVGTLASHQYGIKWGAMFNTAHWAILRLYRTVEYAHQNIVKDYVVRIYTDCFTLKASTPPKVLELLEEYLASHGFSLGTKALGYGQLWSQEEGFIGYKNEIGTGFEVQMKMQRLGLKFNQRAFTDELVQNFSNRLTTHVLDTADRKVFGHWNNTAFFSICQPVAGESDKSSWYQVYPMDEEKAQKYIREV
jgi:hypothetical protein